jgi:hypothetical protein
MPPQADLTQDIDTLSETQAVQALTVLLEDRGLLQSAHDMPATEEELRSAVETESAEFAGVSATGPFTSR